MTSRLVLGLVFVVTASNVAGQAVTGRVTNDVDSIALRGVSVLLISESGDVERRAITDPTGRFLIRASAGNYRVVADHLGYQRLESPLMRVAIDQTVTIDFELPIDPIEVEGVRVEVQRHEELLRRVAQYGVFLNNIGRRYVPRSEIERRETALNAGEILQWQNLAGVTVAWGNVPPTLCVQVTRNRGRCALTVLDGAVVDDEFAASVPPEYLEAIVVLTPMEATLSYGTDGGGGAVLLFTRASVRGR
jgi:Carboxypeptidase regulatory-like domain